MRERNSDRFVVARCDGIPVGRFFQLFIVFMQSGKTKPSELAQAAWDLIATQGQRIVKEGKTLEGEKENMAELLAQAELFVKTQLPIFKALGVV